MAFQIFFLTFFIIALVMDGIGTATMKEQSEKKDTSGPDHGVVVSDPSTSAHSQIKAHGNSEITHPPTTKETELPVSTATTDANVGVAHPASGQENHKKQTGPSTSKNALPDFELRRFSKREAELIFKNMDKNNNGYIDRSDLTNLVKRLGRIKDDSADLLLKEAIPGWDDTITFEEFYSFLNSGWLRKSDDPLGDLLEAFKTFDKNRNDFIDVKELKAFLSELGIAKTLDECKKMIAEYDVTGDERINIEEFIAMMLEIELPKNKVRLPPPMQRCVEDIGNFFTKFYHSLILACNPRLAKEED